MIESVNTIKAKALKTLKLWSIPHILGRDINVLLANLTDSFVRNHRSALRSANVAHVITAVATGNGLTVRN